MDRATSYNTKQREAIANYIISLGNTHTTAAGVVSHFRNSEFSVGRTTVYRHLDKLVQEGILRKYSIEGIAGACYQYVRPSLNEQKRLLLKCEDCGELLHLSSNVLEEIHRHIYEDHTFKVNTARTVFYGKCEACFNAK